MEPTRYPRALIALSPLFALALSACATAEPPAELLQARMAYKSSQDGAAWQYNPAGLHAAEIALKQAETSFKEDGDSKTTREAATVAMRRAQQAEVDAETSVREQARADLALASQLAAASERQTALDEATALEAEVDDQLTSSGDTAAAAMGQDDQHNVMILAVALFPPGESSLPRAAHEELDQVANALQGRTAKAIHIQGHSDSSGSDELNMALSRERAEGVANYLASRGLPRERMTTVALGDTDPAASEKSAEGQAKNRRVELVIYAQTPS